MSSCRGYRTPSCTGAVSAAKLSAAMYSMRQSAAKPLNLAATSSDRILKVGVTNGKRSN